MKNARFLASSALATWASLAAATTGAAQLREIQGRTMKAHDGTLFAVTTGFVQVSEERARPGVPLRTIDLAVVRIHRPGSTRAGAHVILAGGPGDSGVNLVLGMAKQGGASLSDLIGGDYIGIDQRGTGQSRPNLASSVLYDLPVDKAGSPEAWRPAMERAVRAAALEFRARDIRLEAYNTRESADDLDDVRRALGYERLTLWGRSYGSHLALATLRRHPKSIERLILIGPEGPNHTLKLPSTVDSVVKRLGDKAEAPELFARMKRVIERLALKPAVVEAVHPLTGQPVTVSISAFDLQWITFQALSDPRAIATLPASYEEMDAGRFSRIAPLLAMKRARLGVESAMKQMVDLSSGATPARRLRIERESEASLLGAAVNFPLMDLREAWGFPDLGDEFREPVKSDVPVLILVGDLDARTPIENGREILETLSHGQMVVVVNGGHQFDVFGSTTLRPVLAAFLKGERIPMESVSLPPLAFAR